MASGQNITVGGSIGDPLTGTISASTLISPPLTGNNVTLIDQQVPSGGSPVTICAKGFAHADIEALGFVATLVTAGTQAASIVVNLKNANTGGATDITIPLAPASGVPNGAFFISAADAGVASDITSITVTPDANGAVVRVQAKIYVST